MDRNAISKPASASAQALPADIRELAEFAIDDAAIFSRNLLRAEKEILDAVENDLNLARSGTQVVTGKVISLAARNFATFFDYSRRIISARDLSEAVGLQFEFLQTQAEAAASQYRDLTRTIVRATLPLTREKAMISSMERLDPVKEMEARYQL